ncbi:MAG: ISL3 family transposase [Actinomycetota bacterium]|nr:ISL3 family transposase [Actinomycetota bacterium]
MRFAKLWQRLLGVERTVIEGVVFDEDAGAVVASVRPRKGATRRCGVCGRRCPWYDRGEGRRRWRALDLGFVLAFLEADAPRVSCPAHGVVVVAFPWARHRARHTTAFEDQCAWLAKHCSRSAVEELMRVAWRTVGAIVARVVADAHARVDPLDGLRRIGIDEVAYKRGHRYLIVIVDHDSGRLIWAAPGRDKASLGRFFDELGKSRCARLREVSADGAEWIAGVVASRCLNARLVMDAFHTVSWATDALDEVRREVWNDARRDLGDRVLADRLKGCRYALWKNPENLTGRQRGKLHWVAYTNRRLYRAYLLKEELRLAIRTKGDEGVALLSHWLNWASHCQIGPFVQLARKIRRHRGAIESALRSGTSNALVESTNTKIRVLTRVAFGFASPQALIAMAMLAVGGTCPPLPGRPHQPGLSEAA